MRPQHLLELYYEMQKEVGDLANRTGHDMKLYSVVPEADIAITPITICSTVMMHLANALRRGKEVKGKDKKKAMAGKPEKIRDISDPRTWGCLFNMETLKKLRNEPWVFADSVTTDGVVLCVRFVKRVSKAPYVSPKDFAVRQVDLTRPGLYTEKNTFNEEELRHANLVGLDPGIKSVVTAVRLADVDLASFKLKDNCKPLMLSQAQYSEESMLRYKLKKNGTLKCAAGKKRGRRKSAHSRRTERNRRKRRKRKARRGRSNRGGGGHRKQNPEQTWVRRTTTRTRVSHTLGRSLKHATAVLQKAPSPKLVHIDKYTAYLKALASVWDDLWAHHSTIKRRKINFFVARRREKFMHKVVMSFERRFGPKPVILFGNGGDNNLFARLRGCGVKGPVKEIKRRLAERYAVISCSEYRTSKLCIQCGSEVHVHQHGVVYCKNSSHGCMQNRDVAAAVKIGALFLAKKQGADLGPWAWGSIVTEHTPSSALTSALIGHSALAV